MGIKFTEEQLNYIAQLMDDEKSSELLLTVGDFSTDEELLTEQLIELCIGRVASMGSDGAAEIKMLFRAAMAVGQFISVVKTDNWKELQFTQGKLINAALDIANSLRVDIKLNIELEEETI